MQAVTRRQFGRMSIIGVATAALAPTVVLTESCGLNTANLITAVIDAIGALLKVAAPTESWVASLEAALTAVQNAEASWKAGGTVAVIIDAMDALEAVLAVVPITEPYVPLIEILVSAVSAVLTAFEPTTTGALFAKVKATRIKYIQNPFYGKVPLRKPHFWQSYDGAFRSQWNDEVKGLGLMAAQI